MKFTAACSRNAAERRIANNMQPISFRHLVKRLGNMSWDEGRDRCRQAIAKRADALRARVGFELQGCELQNPAGSAGRFFFSATSVASICALLRQRLPERVQHILTQAEKICEHRLDLLGYVDLDCGRPIQWHSDAVHGITAPKKPFFRIKYLDLKTVGDSKVTWELNRHQHLVTLAKAYRLSGDRRFAQEIVAQWRHWQVKNPYPTGINWASSLEIAFRSLSWLWFYHLLEGTGVLPDNFRAEFIRAQALNGRHIGRYLSTYFSPNTHLLGEAVALFFLGVLCPELASAERWKSDGWRIIRQQSLCQVRADGFYFEQSTYYHVYALDLLLHSILLAKANGIEVAEDFTEIVEKMLHTLSLLGRNGPPPFLGDDDGGRLFDPSRNRRQHLLDPLSTGAIHFHRPDFKAVAGDLREETLWLVGTAAAGEWDALPEVAPAPNSTALQDSGLYLMKPDASTQLIVDAGPQGTHGAGHGHADALSVAMQHDGHSLLVDPGTFVYVGNDGDRETFRGTSAHNTIRVDGQDQSHSAGVFSWDRLTRTTVNRWIKGQTFDLLAARHDGYSQLPSPVLHARWVIAFKFGFSFIRDLLHGEGDHQIDVSWHLAPELRRVAPNVYASTDRSLGLTLITSDAPNCLKEDRQSWWSPCYGKKEISTVVNLTMRARLPVELATILLPASIGDESPVLVSDCEPGSDIQAYHYAAATGIWSVFFADSGKPWQHGHISSDAEFVAWHRAPGVGNQVLIFCNGSFLDLEGKRWLHTSKVVESCELILNQGCIQTFCSNPDAILPKDLGLS